ncbi:MAG: hypothetical protein ACMUIP_06220 [bacterium]
MKTKTLYAIIIVLFFALLTVHATRESFATNQSETIIVAESNFIVVEDDDNPDEDLPIVTNEKEDNPILFEDTDKIDEDFPADPEYKDFLDSDSEYPEPDVEDVPVPNESEKDTDDMDYAE